MNALQQTPEWFANRTAVITGSRVGAILGLSPYAKRDDVMREMVREYLGTEREFTGNAATAWGNEHESTAIECYEDETGELVVSSGFVVHPVHNWLGASPDGLVGNDGLIEVKCPYSGTIAPLSERPHYYAQIQLQLACTGRQWCDFYTWTPGGSACERVAFDPDWLPDVLMELEAFHKEFLQAIELGDDSPHLKPLEVERRDIEWVALEAAYEDAQADMDAAKARLDEVKSALIQAANGVKSRGQKYMAFPVCREGPISYAKAIKDLCPSADLEKYRGKPSESWTIRKVGDKA